MAQKQTSTVEFGLLEATGRLIVKCNHRCDWNSKCHLIDALLWKSEECFEFTGIILAFYFFQKFSSKHSSKFNKYKKPPTIFKFKKFNCNVIDFFSFSFCDIVGFVPRKASDMSENNFGNLTF